VAEETGMGIFGRIWRIIKGWLLIGVEKAEDPEVILAEAQESMRRELAKAKENAVMAIAQRNQLRQMLTENQEKAAAREGQARAALKSGQEDLARQLLVEKGTYDTTIAQLQNQLEMAEVTAQKVKESIRSMEDQVRQKAAERLALVAGWKQAQIQEKLNKALTGISLDGQNEAWERAETRIKELQAKSEARLELAQGGLQEELGKLEARINTDKADQELLKLKAEMGMLPESTETNETEEQTQTTQTVRNIEV
jgi:phage shock protein A